MLGTAFLSTMPYARRYKRKSSFSRSSYKRRKPAAAPPRKKTLRTYVRRNAYKNAKQSRQIRAISNKLYGAVQRNLQTAVSSTGVSQPITVSATSPILWDSSDATCFRTSATAPPVQSFGCRIWRVNATGNNLDSAGWWTTSNFDNNAYWKYSNLDIVDGGRYKPIAFYYTIDWTVVGAPDNAPPFVYLHLFTQKAGMGIRNNAVPPGQSIENFTMPYGLVHLQNMASGDLNKFNPDFFKVYKVKRIPCIRNVAASDETIGSTQHYYMNFSVHPKKERFQLKTSPPIPGTVETEGGQTDFGSYGAYNVDPRTPFWCMLSSSSRAGDQDNFTNVKIIRKTVWRDCNGSTRLI